MWPSASAALSNKRGCVQPDCVIAGPAASSQPSQCAQPHHCKATGQCSNLPCPRPACCAARLPHYPPAPPHRPPGAWQPHSLLCCAVALCSGQSAACPVPPNCTRQIAHAVRLSLSPQAPLLGPFAGKQACKLPLLAWLLTAPTLRAAQPAATVAAQPSSLATATQVGLGVHGFVCTACSPWHTGTGAEWCVCS